MHEIIQRKTGAQPGNQNARKHGFYSKALQPPEKRGLEKAAGVEGLDQEIAILRIKFRSLISQDGQNLRLINQTAKTLARLYQIKFNLSKSDTTQLIEAVRTVFADFVIPQPPDSGTESKGSDSVSP
jgi:hypothetical protein